MKAKLFLWMAAALLAIASTRAQVFVLDDFQVGDFSVVGATEFSQNLPEENVLGGVRNVSLSNTTFDRATVASGTVSLVRNENSILRLTYGSFGDANPAGHLHFDAGPGGETTLDIEVPTVRREGMTVIARAYSFTLNGGAPQEGISSTFFVFRSDEPLRKSIPLADFVGDADLRDIAGLQLQLGDIDGFRTTIEVSEATLTAIPEPKEYAVVAAAGLVLWAVSRRRDSLA